MQMRLRLHLAGCLILRLARVLTATAFDSVRTRWRLNFLLVSIGDGKHLLQNKIQGK